MATAKPARKLQTGKARCAPQPKLRRLTIVAQDPSVLDENGRILMATVEIPYEDLSPGPRGHRVHVVDYDATRAAYFGGHDLPKYEPAAWSRGSASIIGDRAFHAQNVYALIMRTLFRFEYALGRRISWGFGSHHLNIAPHAFVDANAFYSRDDQGLMLGYLQGVGGSPVYCCLSHDVVVHETTHALIDGLRERYLDPSSPDQAAFHEGFSDVIALLSVLSLPEVVMALLTREELIRSSTRQGRSDSIAKAVLSEKVLRRSTLFGLAEQMGAEMRQARGDALRRSIELRADKRLLETGEYQEPHRRGEILVAAVMNSFLHVWRQRIVDLGEVEPARVSLGRVAEDGAEAADYLTTMLVRALDYLPPVDVSFGDVLSGVLTADTEIRPDDSKYRFRDHLRRGFCDFGIAPASNRADPDGIWESPPHPDSLRYDRVHHEPLQTDPEEVFRFLWENRQELGLREEPYTRVLSVRPCLRIGPDGFTLRETVAEYYQVLRITAGDLGRFRIARPEGMPSELSVSLYGGGALIFDEFARLKYHVSSRISNWKRQEARLHYLWEHGHFRKGGSALQRLSTLHRMRALAVKRVPRESW